VDDLVKLPEVEMIGLQPAQAVFQVGLGVLSGAPAALGHEEDLVASISLRDRLSHPLFGTAVVVVPRVVEEGDSFIDCALDEPDAVVFVGMDATVEAPQSDERDSLPGGSEGAQRYARGVLRASRLGTGRGERGRRQTGGACLHEFAAAWTG